MRFTKRLLAAFLSAVMILTCFPATALAEPCYHPKTPTKFDYRRNSSKEGDIDTYALCPDCGEWYLYCYPNTTGVGGHEWVQTDFAYTTCTTDGYYTIECQRCHAKETTITDKAYGHRWGDWEVVSKPTCTEDGVRKRTCEECYEVETSHTPATGHDWGEWTVTRPAGHGEAGEETRECSVCHEKETREVSGEEALAKVGDSSLEVLVAQQLLADGGEFTGTVDGVFGEDLAAAIRAFEKSSGIKETGEIYKDTLELLTTRYLGTFEDGFTPDGLLEYFDSGLMTLLYISDHCMSNGDGTHDNAPYAIGVRYLLNSEELDVYIMPENFIYFDTCTESCSIGNETHTCPKCGYHAELSIDYAALEDYFLSGSFITFDLADELALPEIENLFYDEMTECITWDTFPDAVTYKVDMKLDGEIPVVFPTGDTYMAMEGYAQGTYVGTLQAFDGAGEPVSRPTGFGFYYIGNTMPLPEDIVYAFGQAAWSYPYENLSPSFRVALYTLIPKASGEEERKEVYAYLTKNLSWDFSEFYAEYAYVPKGTRLAVSVQAMDSEGSRQSSPVIFSDPVPLERPDYYKATATVNVRSGPGRNYERIGGLSKGDFVLCWGMETGEDGSYYIISYNGQMGYVLSTCLAWFSPKDFMVSVDLTDGRKVSVRTNMDGTIDEVDFDQKVKKFGYLIKHIAIQNDNGLFMPDRVLTPETELVVYWKKDPSYVFVTFINADGETVSFQDPDQNGKILELPIKIGTTCPKKELFEMDLSRLDTYWTTDWEGKEAVVNAKTKFTADMTTLYEHFWYWQEEYDMTIGRSTLDVTDIYKCMFSDTKLDSGTQVLGMLEPGEKIRFIDRVTEYRSRKEFTWDGRTWSVEPYFYKIYSYRLEQECYVLRFAFDRMESNPVKVYFDANGGWCPIKEMTAEVYRNYGFRTILKMPSAVKDGYVFAGWVDENGTLYRDGAEFRLEKTYLKAKWEVGVEYPTKLGVTVPSSFSADRERIYWRPAPESEERNHISPGKEVTVIGENRLMYQCLCEGKVIWIYKDNVCTDFVRTLNNRDFWSTVYATPGGNWLGGINPGGYYYIVGEERKGYLPVVFDGESQYLHIRSDDPDAARIIASGFAWMKTTTDSAFASTRDNRIIFDPLRGYCDQKEGVLCPTMWINGERVAPKLESIPIAYLPGHKFEGWYTDPIGGVLITSETRFDHSMTLYAHYEDAYEAICVATERAPIYSRPSTSKGTILGYVEIGEAIAADDESKTGLFYYTNHKGVTGWVQSRYLAIAEVLVAKADPKIDKAMVRSAPKKKAKSYRKLVFGESFCVIDGEGSYSKVAYPESDDGFAYVARAQLVPPGEL